MSHLLAAALIATIAPLAAHADLAAGYADDADLAGPTALAAREVPVTLTPDSHEVSREGSGLTIEVLREDHGEARPVAGLVFAIPNGRGGSLQGRYRRGPESRASLTAPRQFLPSWRARPWRIASS